MRRCTARVFLTTSHLQVGERVRNETGRRARANRRPWGRARSGSGRNSQGPAGTRLQNRRLPERLEGVGSEVALRVNIP